MVCRLGKRLGNQRLKAMKAGKQVIASIEKIL